MLKKKAALFCLIAAALGTGCKDQQPSDSKEPTDNTSAPPAEITAAIPARLINQFQHRSDAYTEGLEFVDGMIYESTGRYGQSKLYRYELETGKVQKEINIDGKYFGEGITVMGDKIYMLTYQEHMGFIFDRNSFKQLGTFVVNNAEGWGMTNDGTNIIYSDGTSTLYFMDPATLKVTRQLNVTDASGPVTKINELEYINGYIYANQWETELILKIDPNSGKLVGQSDLRMIRQQAGIPPNNARAENQPEVLNGIAYDKKNNRLFVTGKNWPRILEIKLDN